MKSRRDSRDKEGRSYALSAMRVAAHPTRETILRALEEKPRSTLELEKVTGESRYNLYHHLATLEQSNLVSHRVGEGRTKQFFLCQAGKPDVAYLLLESLRRIGLAGSSMARARCDTIRTKLLRIGARVTVPVRPVRVALSSSCPYQAVFAHA